MGQHQLSSAGKLFVGDCYHPGYHSAFQNARGIRMFPVYYHDFGAALAAVANGISVAQAIAGAAAATITGSLASGGVASNTIPRGVRVLSSNAGDTTQTATFTGTDYYGLPQTERLTLNGTTIVPGKKAFKTITAIAVSAAMTGNFSAGTTDVLGLPVRIDFPSQILTWDSGVIVATTTIVVADSNTATVTTGDVRGTVDPAAALNATLRFACWIVPNEPNQRSDIFGVTPA